MEQPRLNFDILCLLCDCLSDISDVLSFALTCSTLTEVSFRKRLRMAPIVLLDVKSVDRFHAFVLSNRVVRAKYIYGLKLPGPLVYDIPVAERLRLENQILALFKAAVHIQYLDLPTSTPKALFDAAAKLTTVRELNVDADANQGPLCLHLIACRSPLRALRVTGGNHWGGDFMSAYFLHNFLGHLLPTLAILHLNYLSTITVSPAEITTPFLAVRSLKLNCLSGGSEDSLAVLLRLFPNLNDELEIGWWNGRAKEDAFPGIQEQSRRAQDAHGTWSSLNHLICDAQTALLLALQCPILRLSTKIIRPRAGKCLAGALRHNSPRQLHVAVELDEGFDALDGLFPAEAANTLTHLVVSVHFSVNYGPRARGKGNNIHWDRFVDKLLHSIRPLRLTHLRIIFRASVHRSSGTPPRQDKLFQTTCGVDLLPATTRFVDAMPSLQNLFLTARGSTYVVPTPKARIAFERRTLDSWHSSCAWQVVHREEGSQPAGAPSDANLKVSNSCVELSREAKERIMDREGLRLSRNDEDEVWQYSRPTWS